MEPSKTASEHDLLPVIWQELPIELLNVVLTKLPVSALTAFCLVSKSWKALIRSPEFAHRCSSVKSGVCYVRPSRWDGKWISNTPYLWRLAIANLETGSWKALRLESGNNEELRLIAADHGLFCYRVFNGEDYGKEVVLLVQNPVTGIARWITVPYIWESRMESRRSNSTLGGLVMDQTTGSYKVVVAFIHAGLTRETFIYDSLSGSWTVSSAISPALGGEFEGRYIDRSVRCGDDLFWLVELETGAAGWFGALIQYSMKLDTWSSVSKLWPYPEGRTESEQPVNLASFENQMFLVNFNYSAECNPAAEFTNLVPGKWKFGQEELAFLLEQRGCTPSLDGLTPSRAVAVNGSWYVECYRGLREEWTMFAFSKNGSVTRFRGLGA